MVNGVPRPKTIGACGPSGSDLGTSLGTPFTTIHPLLFHTLSQDHSGGTPSLFWQDTDSTNIDLAIGTASLFLLGAARAVSNFCK